MVLDHIAEGSCGFVERPAAFDADGLSRRDLDVVDVISIPHVLKNAVGEAEDEDVLHRLLAQVVVDAEDLVLIEHLVHVVVQLARALEVVAEGLFDDGANPASGLGGIGMIHAVLAQRVDDIGEVLWRRGKVKQTIAFGAELFIEP